MNDPLQNRKRALKEVTGLIDEHVNMQPILSDLQQSLLDCNLAGKSYTVAQVRAAHAKNLLHLTTVKDFLEKTQPGETKSE